ncbi:unnamed protein product, partial [Ascophyllum nodosum]
MKRSWQGTACVWPRDRGTSYTGRTQNSAAPASHGELARQPLEIVVRSHSETSSAPKRNASWRK